MRQSFLWVICVSLLACTHQQVFFAEATMSSSSTSYGTKVKSELLDAIKEDIDVEADIMIQLESPEEVMQRVCASGASRAQQTTCMVENMQEFADRAQEEVKALLARETGRYDSSTFFWINNSVSVKKAQGSLIIEIAKLDTVLEVRPEEIFHTMGNGSGKKQAKKASTMSFGFQ